MNAKQKNLLVAYSDSSSEDEGDQSTKILPSNIDTRQCDIQKSNEKQQIQHRELNTEATTKRRVQNKAKEMKLVRNIAHVEGNFATFIYLPLALDQESISCLESLSDMCTKEESLTIKPIDPSDLHISLSKTVFLNYHQIDSFTKQFRALCSEVKGFLFSFKLEGMHVFRNEFNNRLFAVVDLIAGKSQVLDLIKKINTHMQNFGLEQFYENPVPHISLLWALEGLSTEILPSILQKHDINFKEIHFGEINSLSLKIGERITHLDMSTSR